MKVLDGLYYSQDHEWIRIENEKAYIGISDYAQNSLGSIVFVELPEIATELSQGDSIGVIESVKAASDIYSPISGTVVEVMEELTDTPELLNEAPYDNWLVCLENFDTSELESLMDADAYKEFIKEE